MSFKPSDRLKKLPPYLFAEMERKKRELQAQGKDIINLGIGDPDQPPPELALRALTESLREPGIHQYSPSQGPDVFRQGVVRWMQKRYGVALDPSRDVTLCVGSKEGIAHIPLALTDPGDTVIFPEPGYPPYRSGTIFALAEPCVVPLHEKNGFLPDLKSISESVWKKSKIIFVNYPNNPTGAVATRAFYEDLIGYAKRYGTLVVSDAAYAELYYEEKPISFLQIPGAKEVGIEVHSMTKTFNMAGWRVAWAVGNPEVVEILRGFKANVDSGQFMVLQKAAVTGLVNGEKEMAAIRAMYQKRRDVCVNGLRSMGWDVPMPKATFYVWFHVPLKMSSMDFANLLLEKAGVVVTPGVGFGQYGEGFVRIALTVTEDRLREAIERLKKL